MPGLRANGPVAYITLAVASVLALAIYWPGLDSPFMGDDYRYLLASRDMSWGSFLHDAWLPWVEREASEVSKDHWRPLSWTYFRVQYQFFGDEPIGYHLTSFAAHLAGIVMVWLLARRLVKDTAGVAIATLVFAVHPAGFETVTWISALSLAAFPLALAGWLAFIVAVQAPEPARRRRYHALALALFAAALLNRETAIAVFPAMGLWYLLVHQRASLRSARAYRPLVPYVALAIAYLLANSWFFTVSDEQQLSADLDAFRRTWFYVKQALLPTTYEGAALVARIQQALGLVVLVTPLVALAARRWLLVALSLGFLASLVPYGLFSVGFGPRYFYFPSAFFALALGAAAAELWPFVVRPGGERRVGALAATGVAVIAVGVAAVGLNRVDRWVDQGPAQEQRWIDDLRRVHPELPDGGTLYVTNVPFHMALLNGYVVEPTVAYLYPGGTHKVQVFFRADLEDVRPWLEPDDRLFVFGEQ